MRRSRSFSGFNRERGDDDHSANLDTDAAASFFSKSPPPPPPAPPPPPPPPPPHLSRSILRGVFDANAPLPYSKYEDSKPPAASSSLLPRRRMDFHSESRRQSQMDYSASPSLSLEQQRQRDELTSLLTPIVAPPWFSSAATESSSASISTSSLATSVRRHRQLQLQRGEEFVHQESVLTRPFYSSRQQSPWIHRWSDDTNSSSASVPGLGYVPSAAAMAIVSKCYTNSLTTPSWSNSITSWESDADSKDARRR